MLSERMSNSDATGRHFSISVINTVLANGGDAAIVLGLARALRTAYGDACRLTVYDSLPEWSAPRYPELEIKAALHAIVWEPGKPGIMARILRAISWNLKRIHYLCLASQTADGASDKRAGSRPDSRARGLLQSLDGSDFVVSTGGTYLVEQYWLGLRLFEFDLVRRLRKPLVLYTQSLGPFTKPVNRRALHGVFEYASLVLVRDELSRGHALELAPRARVEVRADAAFALAEPDVLKEARSRALPQERPLRVAISVRDWPHFTTTSAAVGMERFRKAIAALVVHLIHEHDAEILFVSTCQGIPSYRFDDSGVAATIVEGLPAEVQHRVQVRSEYLRPEAVMAETGACDLVVATRMHMAILSLCAGTPVLPIAYEFKTRELFGRLGMGERVQDIETVTGEALISTLGRMLVDLPSLRPELFERVEAERADAMAAGIRVRDVMEEDR